MSNKIRIGTRGSKLARIQAEIVKQKFLALNPDLKISIDIISTRGDIEKEKSISEIGGKGIFIKDLELALKDKRIDLAIHSFKDITSNLDADLELAGFLKPESQADCLILKEHSSFNDLPQGSILATGSLRRKAILKKLRPDIKVVDLRGNVTTRIEKLKNNNYRGIVLSEAGMIRLGLSNMITYRFDPKIFCPAPGQGVIAMQTHKKNYELQRLCFEISDQDQYKISKAEIAFLKIVGFDCNQALGLYTRSENSKIIMKYFFADPKMKNYYEEEKEDSLDNAIILGKELGEKVKGLLCP